MKKILLSVFAVASLAAANAQVYSCNDSTGFAAWTSYDNDGDGFEWSAIDFTGSTNALQNAQGGCAVSYSYDNGTAAALTPDNIFVSPAIDLTGATGAVLDWGCGSSETTASGWFEEHYAVYVATTADLPGLATGTFPTPVFEGTLTAGEVMETQSFDISSMAGMTGVYVVIRHFNCTDEFVLIFDDVEVYGQYASVEENNLEVSVYPNPANDVLNFTLNADAETVSVYGLDGKLISTEYVNASTGTIDVSALAEGTYFYEFTTADGSISRDTFVKK